MPSDIYQWDQDRRHQRRKPSAVHRDYAAMPRSPAEALEPDHAPQPPVGRKVWRQHPVLRIMNNVMTLLFVTVIGLMAMFYFIRWQFDQPGPLEYATVVVVPKGEGLREIAGRLEREGVIGNQQIFVASAIYFRAQSKLKAGEYAITKHSSIRQVLDTLVEGKAILHSVSFPEGFTSFQIVERLNIHPELTGKVSNVPPEGTLLPDTYRFARGTDRDELLARMAKEQKKFIEKIWPTRAAGLPIKTQQEAIILASIVEKETGKADERPRVASVFVNRLRKNMRLESDPTIIYGLAGGKATLGRGILRSEIQQMTPYNTYRINGLPPTPIANPGRAALEAVLRPAKTSDLFFVADGTGGHVFAENYEDHKKNVAEWRIIEKEIRARQAAAEAEKQALAVASGSTTAIPGVAVATTTPTESASDDAGQDGVPIPERKPAL